MRGLFFDQGISHRVDLPEPKPKEGEALIKVLAAGICQTDIEILKGYMAFQGIPGHEFVGEVASPGPLRGKRVVGEINCPCGACEACSSGLGNHCAHRTVLGIAGRDGCFAEMITLPIKNLYPVPDALSNEEALFTEPLAAAFQIVKQVPLSGKKRAFVLGDGRLGLLAAQVLRDRCREVLLVGRNNEKLEKAKLLGIRTLLRGEKAFQAPADLVVDATGSIKGLHDALKLVRPRGTIVLKTTVAKKYDIDLAGLVVNEITLIGSRCGPFPDALDALTKKKVHVAPLISAAFPLSDWQAAFRRAQEENAFKVVFTI